MGKSQRCEIETKLFLAAFLLVSLIFLYFHFDANKTKGISLVPLAALAAGGGAVCVLICLCVYVGWIHHKHKSSADDDLYGEIMIIALRCKLSLFSLSRFLGKTRKMSSAQIVHKL